MRPFATVAGGAIEHGSANEEQVVLVLRQYVKSFSQKLYDIDPVREFGLIVRRECRVCTSSPDGVLALKKRNQAGLEFKQAIPENAYRYQVCQHAAALGLSYVLIVYCTPGALPKK